MTLVKGEQGRGGEPGRGVDGSAGSMVSPFEWKLPGPQAEVLGEIRTLRQENPEKAFKCANKAVLDVGVVWAKAACELEDFYSSTSPREGFREGDPQAIAEFNRADLSEAQAFALFVLERGETSWQLAREIGLSASREELIVKRAVRDFNTARVIAQYFKQLEADLKGLENTDPHLPLRDHQEESRRDRVQLIARSLVLFVGEASSPTELTAQLGLAERNKQFEAVLTVHESSRLEAQKCLDGLKQAGPAKALA